MSSNKSKISPRERLIATTEQAKIELNEQELGRIAGGIIIIGGIVRDFGFLKCDFGRVG